MICKLNYFFGKTKNKSTKNYTTLQLQDNNIYFALSVFGAAACIEEEEGNVVTDWSKSCLKKLYERKKKRKKEKITNKFEIISYKKISNYKKFTINSVVATV